MYKIGLVTSANKKNWARWNDRPSITPGLSGAWDSGGHAHPCLVKVSGVVYMFFSGYDGTSVWKIGLARSYSNGISWVKESSPILSPSQAWENNIANTIDYPKVIYDTHEIDPNKKWKMWYGGGEYGVGGIGYAYSPTGLPGTWTKFAANPVLTLAGSGWESYYMSPSGVVWDGAQYILFYSASSTAAGAYSAGYATFADPEGVYTKSADNPILGGDGITSALSATVNIGDSQISVADANLFPVGCPVWVYDATNSYLTHVASIQSATVLAMVDAAPIQISSTGGNVRSVAYGGCTIETVSYDAGNWMFAITPFKPGIGGVAVKEVAMTTLATNDLTNVEIDYASGLAVPFGARESAGASSLHKSNENLNFIPD